MNYIVDFLDTATQEQIDSWLVSNSATASKRVATLSNVFVVECAAQPTATDIVTEITEDVNVSAKLLNTVEVIPAATTTTATFDHDADWWKTASVGELEFSDTSTTYEKRGARTNVYIVDSGIMQSHNEFVGVNVQNLFSFNNDFSDTNGHGTAIASVIAGNNLGITNSVIKSVKIFDSSKTTMTSDLVAAFDAILSDVIANQGTASIVNLSWSIPKDAYVESKIQALLNAGALVVASAGNSGVPIEQVTPASMADVFTIGAYTEDFVPAEFSNYTSTTKNTPNATNFGALDGWAPGTNINVATLDGSVGVSAGTSIAAGIMTACLAYNSDRVYTETQVVPAYHGYLTGITLRKANLLTLSDKYEGSVNIIAAFSNKAGAGLTSGTYSAARIIYANHDTYALVAFNSVTQQIVLDGVLPEGLYLSNGWIVGRMVNPPAETQKLEYTVTVTFNTGEIHSYRLQLILAPATVAPGDAPAGVSLDVVCGWDDAMGYCPDGGCSGFCRECDKYWCQCSFEQCM
jgi:hypothetical protein